MVTNNNNTTTIANSICGGSNNYCSSNPFKRLFRHSRDHHHPIEHHHHCGKSLNNHTREDDNTTLIDKKTVVKELDGGEEEDFSLPSSSLVISSFTLLNNRNKRRFSLTNHHHHHHQLQTTTPINNENNKKTNIEKEKKRKLVKNQSNKKNFFQLFKSNHDHPSSSTNDNSNQLQSEKVIDKHHSIDFNGLDFEFSIVDQPITSNTSYMTNCTTTSSVDHHFSNRTFLTNVHNTTFETPLDRILLLNEATKLAKPLSKKVSHEEKRQLCRGKPLKVTSNEHIFGQPLKSNHSSISNGDKRRRVGENSESMILSDCCSPSNSFTVMSDEVIVTSPTLDQSSVSLVEEFLD